MRCRLSLSSVHAISVRALPARVLAETKSRNHGNVCIEIRNLTSSDSKLINYIILRGVTPACAMCSKVAEGECCYFAEYLPRVSAFQIAFATRETCKLSFTPRRVFITENEAGSENEICHWPPQLPELNPGSCLNRNHCTAGPLHLRFQCRGRNAAVAGTKGILDPQDLINAPADLLIRCGFCSQVITPLNQ